MNQQHQINQNEALDSNMAAFGTLVADFVSQGSVFLIVAVVTTILLVAVSTYFIARNYVRTNSTAGDASVEVSQQQTAGTTNEDDRSSASESDDTNSSDLNEHSREPGSGSKRLEEIDPVMYCEHIQGEIKRVKQEVATRKIRETLTQEQIEEERLRQQEQLSEIFRLMQEQNERFGISSIDEMKEQMKLYGNL
ncbi:hypothetical protein BaRGS_00015979 [Batillaria attramentaria]|uniref:Matrix-remodeling-associated protein 7 helical domain-containing protein n=1 Tax=Batillaria attramentaria TaxID=370345 RepID=A0ABD0L0F0_9CAEN